MDVCFLSVMNGRVSLNQKRRLSQLHQTNSDTRNSGLRVNNMSTNTSVYVFI